MRGRWLSRGIDPRLASMLLALVIIWIGLQVLTDGIFLSPRNLYNLSMQASAVAIMSCGMVFVIVARQIDLSVGSLLAFTGVLTAYAQVHWLEAYPESGWIWSILVGVGVGAVVGLFQGWWVAYRSIPAFVVTAAPRTSSPRGRPSLRSTRPISGWAAARMDRSASPRAGCFACSPASG